MRPNSNTRIVICAGRCRAHALPFPAPGASPHLDSARLYLDGLFQCRRRNIEKMAEEISCSHYQRLHHMLSELASDRWSVRQQLIADANVYCDHAGGCVAWRKCRLHGISWSARSRMPRATAARSTIRSRGGRPGTITRPWSWRR